ncbi:MAG: hypothetical protein II709_11160 [Ruminococcus sp.]|nr:hypothetical protein [Ruminococcus sp.]MBQ4262434.1 hypothetical protein [Ruminococcus sp.]
MEDLHEITLDIKNYAAQHCGRRDFPVTLLGHSRGALAARCYIRKYDADISKLCLTGSQVHRFSVALRQYQKRSARLEAVKGDRRQTFTLSARQKAHHGCFL